MGTVRSRQLSWIALLAAALLVVSGLLTPAQAATKRALSIAIKPTSSYAGASVAVSGKISRSPKGTVVKIQRKAGKKWVAVASTRTTTAAGNYSRPVTLPKVAGTYSFRAVAPKTKKLRSATSRTVKVLALRKVTATIKLSALVLQLGQQVTLSGTVSPFLAGKTAFIQRFNGAQWIDLMTVTIAKNGTYKRTYTPPATTTYRVAVPRLGLYAAALSASTKLTISNGPVAPTITTTSVPTGAVGSAYKNGSASVVLSATGKPGTWAVTGANLLPAGLSLNATTGAITGTPTTAGNFLFTVTYSETSTALSDSQALSIRVYAQPTITTGATLVNGVKGSAYNVPLARSGGSPAAGTWTSTGALPAGMSLTTAGVLTGTPTATGTFSFTAKFDDEASGVNDATKSFTLNVFDHPVVTTASLPFGVKGQLYSQQLAKNLGSGSGTWTATGALPAGLTLSSGGLIAGTPTADGDTAFVVRFTDSGTGLNVATKSLSIKVYAQPTITTSTLPGTVANEAYSQQLTRTGGSATGQWTVVAGTLPAGLTLSSGGLISGTPTTFGFSSFTVKYTDDIAVLDDPTKVLEIKVFGDPAIVDSPLPIGIKDTAYSQQVVVAGGSGEGAWSIASGALPTGLSLSAAGVISGTPTVLGASTFVVQFTDSDPRLAPAVSEALGITVYTQPTITTSTLTSGTPGTPYSQQLVVAGGSDAGAWSLAAGALPAGLTLSAAGLISGTPTVAGNFPITVKFADEVNGLNSPTRALSIRIIKITTTGLPDVLRNNGTSYSAQLTLTSGTGAGVWSVQAGALPTGISLSASGSLTGTSGADIGDYPFTAKFVEAGSGTVVTKSLTIHVDVVAIKTASLPDGSVGATYSATMSGVPTLGSLGWSINGGTLPPGLSFSSSGVFSGKPTVAGDYTFTVSYAVLLKGVRNRQFTIHVNPAG